MKFCLCVSTTGTLLARVDGAHLTVGLVGLYSNIRPKCMTVWDSFCFLDLSRGPSTLATLTEVIEGKRLRSMPHDLEQKGRCSYLRFQPQLDCCGVLSFWSSKFLIMCKVHGIKWYRENFHFHILKIEGFALPLIKWWLSLMWDFPMGHSKGKHCASF